MLERALQIVTQVLAVISGTFLMPTAITPQAVPADLTRGNMRAPRSQSIPLLACLGWHESKGIEVSFITGRVDQGTARQDTETNLRKAGHAVGKGLSMKSLGDKSSVTSYKTAQREQIERGGGYVIIENVGD
jgi:hypothetical protein